MHQQHFSLPWHTLIAFKLAAGSLRRFRFIGGHVGADVLDHVLEGGIALRWIELLGRLVGGGQRFKPLSTDAVVGLQLYHLTPKLLSFRLQLTGAHLCSLDTITHGACNNALY